MPQTNYTPIQLYRSSTASATPAAGNLQDGELALNDQDGKLFYKDASGNVQQLAAKVLDAAHGGTGQTSFAVGDILYASGTSALSKLSPGTSGYVLTSGGAGAAPTWTAVSGGGGMVYPGAGIAVSTGSAWTTSKTAPSGTIVGTTDSQTLTNKVLGDCTVDGTNTIGFRNIPQNSQSSSYTLVLTDAGKHVYKPASSGTGDTYTIPANSSVAFPIGTAITFVNDSSSGGSATIAITTDTLVLSPTGSTGTRTLAAGGIATAIKVTSTKWMISGTGLS